MKRNLRLTIVEAKRLHYEAPALTAKEIRRLGEYYFGARWLSSANKKTIVSGFRDHLKRYLAQCEKSR